MPETFCQVLDNHPSKLAGLLSWRAACLVSHSRVQRGPSEAARCASTGDQQATLPLPYSNNLLNPDLIWSSPSRKSVSRTSALACTTTRLALS